MDSYSIVYEIKMCIFGPLFGVYLFIKDNYN